MTAEEQHRIVARMECSRGYEQEFKLRRMAREAAAGTETVFPVQLPLRFGSESPEPEATFTEVWVNLLVSTPHIDIRTLLAERILRPQLRELGWDV